MARPKTRCPACGSMTCRQGHYLCRVCWNALPAETQARLYLDDADARNRLFQLLSAIRRGVALGDIAVSA